MESMLMMPDLCRDDLAGILKSVQAQEKQKLHLVFYLPHVPFSSHSYYWFTLQYYYLLQIWYITGYINIYTRNNYIFLDGFTLTVIVNLTEVVFGNFLQGWK